MKNTGKIIDEGVAIFECGKIAYDNPKRKTNMAQIDFGFRKLRGNKEAYLTITGGIWNCKHTDYLTCGASIQEKIQEYVHNDLLAEMIEIGKKYHLMDKSKIPLKVVKRIEEIVRIGLDN